MREAEKRQFEVLKFVEVSKELLKVMRNKIERERKMTNPIDPLPEHELWNYEKLRGNNVKEIE